MRTKRTLLYWSLQTAGWGLYFAVCALLMLATNRKLNIALAWLSIMVGHVLASHLLRVVMKRRQWLDLSPLRLTARLLAACAGIAIGLELCLAPVPPLLQLNSLSAQFGMLPYFTLVSFVLFSGWCVIYVAFQYYFRSLRLEACINEAELRALKAQVNPHFLFNCLTNLRSLIAEDADRAREMILRLSELLRYSLEAGRKDKVALTDELQIVEAYLALEKLQFENRLNWRIDVSDGARAALIPPMLIQQLVENAIKHGISQNRNGGEILIWARQESAGLELRVENTGQLKESTHKGFGIENVRERLRILCGAAASFDLQNTTDGRVAATARIPVAA